MQAPDEPDETAPAPTDRAAAARDAARRALAEHEPAAALDALERVPPDAQLPIDLALELAAWMAVGSLRQVERVARDPRLPDSARADARRFSADPGADDEPPPDLDYAALERRAADLARRGRVRALARAHLALADRAARPDWRWVHVDKAAALSRALGDPRLDALVMAHEAVRDAEFGEDADALELAAEAVLAGERAGEPRAVALARWAESIVRSRPAPADPPDDAPPEPEAPEPTA